MVLSFAFKLIYNGLKWNGRKREINLKQKEQNHSLLTIQLHPKGDSQVGSFHLRSPTLETKQQS